MGSYRAAGEGSSMSIIGAVVLGALVGTVIGAAREVARWYRSR